jgi:hypothetical protein
MPLFWYRTTKLVKVAAFRDESDPSFSIVPESYIRLSTEHQISKSRCGHW